MGIFVLLQIFRLIHLFIPSRTVESFLVIPFQLLIFLLPTYLFARFKSPKSPLDYIMKLRMRLPAPNQIPLMLSSLIALISGTLLISMIFGGTQSLSDGFTLYNTFVSQTDFGFFKTIYLIIAYAAVPAICEELVFRAILCREYERFNVLLGILSSSVFFALLHFDLKLFPVYLFSGILLALSMYATGSVIVPVIIHFFFNVVGLFGQPYLSAFYEVTGGSSGLFAFFAFVVFMLSAALFCNFASKSYQRRSKYSNMQNRPLLPSPDTLIHAVTEIFLTPFSVGAICFYIVVVIIYSLV